MKRLIINADDFGLTAGVSAGILEAIEQGVVSSTTAMVCLPGSTENIQRFAGKIVGHVGLHLQLTDGIPCSTPGTVSTLVDPEGRFPRSWRDLEKPDPDEVRQEWHAQIARMGGLGIRPTHIDTHHHVHRLPAVFDVYAEIAVAYGVPARALTPRMAACLRSRGVTCSDYCEIGWGNKGYEPEKLLAMMAKAFDPVTGYTSIELMCHPGFCDDELTGKTTYALQRPEELRALCDSGLRAGLRDLGIEVIAPAALATETVCPDRGTVTRRSVICHAS